MKYKENKSVKFRLIDCPHGKTTNYPMSGRTCKNNCSLYRNGCKKWN